MSVQGSAVGPMTASAAGQMAGRAESPSWPFSLAGVISVGLLYGLVYSCLRLSISHNLPQDDVTANILAQTLEPGYALKQPPLYEWLLWSVQRLTGPSLPSFLILKYGLLTATFAFLYLVAKRIFADQRWAAIAALSPLLLCHIGWNLHEGVTQTMALICAVAASMWSFMRLAERGRASDHVLFGAIAGLDLISKYSFAGFLAVFLGSALLQPALRARLLVLAHASEHWRRRIGHRAVRLLVGYRAPRSRRALWLIRRTHGGGRSPQGDGHRTRQGDLRAARLLVSARSDRARAFPRHAARGLGCDQGVKRRTFDDSQPDWRLLLLHITLGGFLVLMLGAVLTGATHYLERYMHPFFLLTQLWLIGLVETSGNASRRLAVLATMLLTVTLLVVPIRLRDLLQAIGPECHKCRIAVPYDGLAAALEARGFHAGTIIAADRHDSGNLRRMFPEARIIRVERPAYAPPIRTGDLTSKVAVVWRKGSESRLPKEAESEFAKIAGKVTVAPERLRVPWKPFPPSSSERVWEWVIVVADPAARQ
jgi:hypothetical protein